MKTNKKGSSLKKIYINKSKKNDKDKKVDNTQPIYKTQNISVGKIKTKNEKNINYLIKSNKSEDFKVFEEMIKKDKSLINKLNNKGISLLHTLVIKKNKKLIELLLKNGADVNIKSLKKKRTPLHLAYIYQNEESDEIIDILLNYGAKDDILDINNKKPSYYKKIFNKNNNNKENKNGGENKIKKISIKKERKKEGYKGNIYNLKDSKDNSFVIITMDNISYITSDENTINQISDISITKNNSNNNNPLRDSLDGNKSINNSLYDSLEIEKENNKILEENIDNNIINNINDINNSSENLDSLFTTIITNKRMSFLNQGKCRASFKTEDKNTISSHNDYTENSTFKIINKEKRKNQKILSYNSAMSTLSQTYKKYNKKNEEENDINYSEINNNCSYLLKWLIDIDLSYYYENFLNNKIYDINKLVEQMKSSDDKLGLEDIENIIGIHKPGHIFRILIKLEIDGNIIDKTISDFMIGKQTINKNLFFTSQEQYDYRNCYNEDKININLCGIKNININLRNNKKNDLESFLSRYNLIHLYQNFYHNGFEQINYIILQMYSSFPINNDILENYFHIYNEEQRILTMEAIQQEVFKVNNFIKSEKYLNNTNKDKIKYENVDINQEENNKIRDDICNIF